MSLLLSILVPGFFLPVTGFARQVWTIATQIPSTSGVEGFRNLLMVGTNAGEQYLEHMVIPALRQTVAVILITRRQ